MEFAGFFNGLLKVLLPAHGTNAIEESRFNLVENGWIPSAPISQCDEAFDFFSVIERIKTSCRNCIYPEKSRIANKALGMLNRGVDLSIHQ